MGKINMKKELMYGSIQLGKKEEKVKRGKEREKEKNI